MTGMAMLLKQLIPEDAMQQIGAVVGDINTFKTDVLNRVHSIETKLDKVLVALEKQPSFNDQFADFSPVIANALREHTGDTRPAGAMVVGNDDPDAVVGRLDI